MAEQGPGIDMRRTKSLNSYATFDESSERSTRAWLCDPPSAPPRALSSYLALSPVQMLVAMTCSTDCRDGVCISKRAEISYLNLRAGTSDSRKLRKADPSQCPFCKPSRNPGTKHASLSHLAH